MTTRMQDLCFALAMACVAIGSCTWREAAASVEPVPPPDDARHEQFEEAMRAAFHAKHPVVECRQVHEHQATAICITQQQWLRMHPDDQPHEEQ